MEALYQLFISACKIIAGLSLLGAMWAFWYAWSTEDVDGKFLGWRFLIIAAGAGMFAGVFFILKCFPNMESWTTIALGIVPLLTTGIAFMVLHHRKKKWEAWLDEIDMDLKDE